MNTYLHIECVYDKSRNMYLIIYIFEPISSVDWHQILMTLVDFFFCLMHTYVHAQLCLSLCDSMHRSPPGSSVHGIFQARILEWVVISFSGHLPDPGIKLVSLASPALAGRVFITASLGKPIFCCIVIVDSVNPLSCLASIFY